MNFQSVCDTYLQDIRRTHENPLATGELSLHRHLTTFLEHAATCLGHNVTITHEPRLLEIGRPDFIATDANQNVVGSVEAEKFGVDLDALTGHAKTQNARFIENVDNFILTNFIEFRLFSGGELLATSQITPGAVDETRTLLSRFFGAETVPLATPEALAKHLARRTRELHTQIATALTNENSNIYGMFSAFKERLLVTLTPADFADMYAQTLTYGLFAARCTQPNATQFSRLTAAEAVPRSNPFLRQLFHHIASPNLESNITWILDEIVKLLRNVSAEMLRTAFDRRMRAAEPVIHFYETFLAAYAPGRRVERGVYYTPQPVISYIVRSVDALLKTKLGKPDGLADRDALILDPATGTGGFLMEVLSRIRDNVTETYGPGIWPRYVNEHLAQRLIGFEVLVAPYTIAHLNLCIFLQAQGWDEEMNNERFRIYLTNTLEAPVSRERYAFAEFISDEANAAVSVKKDAPILVIVGNPPYPENSANPSRDSTGEFTFIGRLIEDYKRVDSKPLGERASTVLQGDYVKFIRWAQWRIDRTGKGVFGYIVNNSFLDGPVFRGMRQSLMDSFTAIYHLNLHGSIRRTSVVPDGKRDENVFDIQQGVSILLCVKARDEPTPARVYYADLWGSRDEKYGALLSADVQTTEWEEVPAVSPLYLFVPQSTEHKAEYEAGWKVSDIFQEHSVGFFTQRDKLAVHRSEEAVRQTVADFASLSEREAREKYQLKKDSRDWQVRFAQADLRKHCVREEGHRGVRYAAKDEYLAQISYRPFDTRFTYYTGQSRGFHSTPCRKIMRHLRAEENLALCTCRIVTNSTWQHVLVTNRITEKGYISTQRSESSHVFPLYLYPNTEELELSTERSLNLSPTFLKALSEQLGVPQTEESGLPEEVSPDAILGYLYAILHNPTYRERYAEFLKYDFPRIPLPRNLEVFRQLSALGQELIDVHLFRHVAMSPRHRFEGEGDAVVSKLRYEAGHVWINTTQHFANVPVDVWEFEVGAYQVCEKWLRERRGHRLSAAEIVAYQRMLCAVGETLRLMGEIEAVGGIFEN